MTTCVARPNAQNGIDLVIIGVDCSQGDPECHFGPISLEL
jgi:hypothetical protein